MHLLSWFTLGLAIGAISIVSIYGSVRMVSGSGSLRPFWTGYVFRYLLIGSGMLLAIQWGAEQILAVFLGLMMLRITMLFPGYTRFGNWRRKL